MPAVLRRFGHRTYGGGDADGPPVRGACACTAARRRGLGAPRGGERIGARAARAERALGRAQPREEWAWVPGPAARGVRDVAARGALVLSLK
jgi:hypothetical protein